MGERKVLNKYYPPDFDPAKVPRRKMARDRQYKVRLMAPFNMRCVNCGEYIYKGKKFNAMKETVLDEDYLGLHIFRFYIRCTMCCGVIAFKTDPKNTDYVCEQGATRNFENWRVTNDDSDDEQKKEEFEEQNPMAALEARTEESKREMDILDALEEIKDLNQKNHSKINLDDLLAAKADAKEQLLEQRRLQEEADDEEAARSAFEALREAGGRVKRLESSDEDGDPAAETSSSIASNADKGARRRAEGLDAGRPKKKRQLLAGGKAILVKPKNDSGGQSKPAEPAKPVTQKNEAAGPPAAPSGLGLGVAYSSSDSD